MQREVGNYLFEVGYSGSRGAKGINQIQVNPATLTAEQAATVRAGGTIPSLQSRRLFPQYRRPHADSGVRWAWRQRCRGEERVQRGVRLGEPAVLAWPPCQRVVHVQQVDEQQRRVARRGRHGVRESASAGHVRLRGRSGAARPSTVRIGWPSATSGRSPARGAASWVR